MSDPICDGPGQHIAKVTIVSEKWPAFVCRSTRYVPTVTNMDGRGIALHCNDGSAKTSDSMFWSTTRLIVIQNKLGRVGAHYADHENAIVFRGYLLASAARQQ